MEDGAFVIEGDTYAAFDPLGGAAGEHAARQAGAAFRRAIREGADLSGALVAANVAINVAVSADSTLQGAGCTAAALSLAPGVATVAWVGDVRAMLLRGNDVTVLTREHSLLNDHVGRRVTADERAHAGMLPNVIVRALGMGTALAVETHSEVVAPGDVFVLASSGLCLALGTDLLVSTLITHRHDARSAARAVLDNAVANGGADSLTVVVVVAGGAGPGGFGGASTVAVGD